MPLGLKQLRYFIAIAESRALSHAAQTLNVAQSALSHHVAQLEAEFGVKLIERRPRGIGLTPAGKRLYEHALSIVSAVKKTEEDIRTFSETPSGSISVGLPHTAVELMALPLMQVTRRDWPRIALSVSEGLSVNLANRVLAGEIDLALAFNPTDDSRVVRRPLLVEDMYLVGQAALIGDSDQPIAFADIPRRPILAPFPSGSLRSLVNDHLLRNQLQPGDMLEIDSLTAMRRALETGLGCSILSRATVLSSLTEGRLHARRIVEPELSRTLEQIALRDRPRTSGFVEMERVLSEVVLAEVGNGHWPARKAAAI
jgi:LysR family nitrogen assimilation transcriptional regulator